MKREREKHITRLHIILFFMVVGIGLTVFLVLKNKNDNKLEKYYKLEKDVRVAAENYYIINDIELEVGYEETVCVKDLVDSNLLSNDLAKSCIGYANITNLPTLDGDEEIDYTIRIKCGNNYESEGYQKGYCD